MYTYICICILIHYSKHIRRWNDHLKYLFQVRSSKSWIKDTHIYVHIYIYTYILIYRYMCVYVCICIFMYICIYTSQQAHSLLKFRKNLSLSASRVYQSLYWANRKVASKALSREFQECTYIMSHSSWKNTCDVECSIRKTIIKICMKEATTKDTKFVVWVFNGGIWLCVGSVGWMSYRSWPYAKSPEL